MQSVQPVKVFISYAHEDQELRQKLEEHLSPLIRSEKITIWQDQEIPGGANWRDQISTHLNEADLILFLVSASFIASNYCWNNEVQMALQRHKSGIVQIIPILLRPALWQDTPLESLQVFPTGAKPVTQWINADAAFEDIVRGIKKVVGSIQSRSQRAMPTREEFAAKVASKQPYESQREGQRKEQFIPGARQTESGSPRQQKLIEEDIVAPLIPEKKSYIVQLGAAITPDISLGVNRDGIIALGVVLLLVGVAAIRGWNIAWWYFVLTILGYTWYFYMLLRLKSHFRSHTYDQDKLRFLLFQRSISAHIAFICLAAGLWFNSSNFFVQVVIFVVSIAIGGIPFLVLRFEESDLQHTSPPTIGHLIVIDSLPGSIIPGTIFNLNPQNTIGRSPTNTIRINDYSISSEHTRMWFRDGIWYVQDAGSVNGTFLNNQLARDALSALPGDIIKVGFINFRLEK